MIPMLATLYLVVAVVFYWQIARRSELFAEPERELTNSDTTAEVIELFPQAAPIKRAA